MQSEAWLAVKCMLRDSNVDNTIPTVCFDYNKREFNWNNFYCILKINNKCSTIIKYSKVQFRNDIKVILS